MTAAKPGSISPLDRAAPQSYYRQIYQRFRGAIVAGLLAPGERLPSARALAKELGLARGTVESAYALLAAEGYTQARGQAGTVVSPDLNARGAARASAAPHDHPHPATLEPRPQPVLPFQMGLPALDAFPRKIWARLAARTVRAMQPADMNHPAVSGLPALRAAIAAYLNVARGIACTPAQVIVTSGYRHSMALAAHTLLKPGDSVWVEDPGYPPTRELLALLHMRAVPVAVDEQGLSISAGIGAAPRARAVVVTPAHQSPLSMSLALPRRMELLDWAARARAWVIEDDYDGEYRYVGRPLPALKSLDRDERVIYAGTFSKVLYPGIRLAYLVVPESLIGRFERINDILAAGSPPLTQATVAAFMGEGHFSRHIQRMRRLYGERRQAATAGLLDVLGRHVRIDAQPGGMHLIVRPAGRVSDQRLAARMLAGGMYAHALSTWSQSRSNHRGLLLGFTNIPTRQEAQALGRRILEVL